MSRRRHVGAFCRTRRRQRPDLGAPRGDLSKWRHDGRGSLEWARPRRSGELLLPPRDARDPAGRALQVAGALWHHRRRRPTPDVGGRTLRNGDRVRRGALSHEVVQDQDAHALRDLLLDHGRVVRGALRLIAEDATTVERTTEGQVVGELQVAPDGQAARGLRYDEARYLKETTQVHRGVVALDVGVEAEDDFLHRAVEAVEQLLDLQSVRRHALEGVQHTVQHVVRPVKSARALDGAYVGRAFHDTDDRLVASSVGTDRTETTRLGDVAASLAEGKLDLHLTQ